ncbi:CLUMA_CG011939, isoform A [Clunio marinus]|uniref:CLUMA_CG011939, isoform A n=1 Tax=Clunio marinus TaxID=568069 RepID=A0A1J1IKP3_9DIPT|nr:CLUMA_CG011939, isoform A [Clunio marinus]
MYDFCHICFQKRTVDYISKNIETKIERFFGVKLQTIVESKRVICLLCTKIVNDHWNSRLRLLKIQNGKITTLNSERRFKKYVLTGENQIIRYTENISDQKLLHLNPVVELERLDIKIDEEQTCPSSSVSKLRSHAKKTKIRQDNIKELKICLEDLNTEWSAGNSKYKKKLDKCYEGKEWDSEDEENNDKNKNENKNKKKASKKSFKLKLFTKTRKASKK